MPNVHYFGLLGNVNYSIQFINIQDDLVIEKWPKHKIIEFISEIMGRDTLETEVRFESIYGCGDKKSAYCISGPLTDMPPKSKLDDSVTYFVKMHNYYEAYARKIENKINLLRLCTKGDIKLSFSCFYTVDKSGRKELDFSFETEIEPRN